MKGGALKTDRSVVTIILLSLVTCGIYGFYYYYTLANDMNIIGNGDGEETPGIAQLILLSIVTCGIYSLYWLYKLADRMYNNAPRYGVNIQEKGSDILLWMVIGTLVCGIGSLYALYLLTRNMNVLCAAYNNANGY